jgi:hypothetical protein
MATFTYNNIKIDTEKLTLEDMPNETFQEIFEFCGAEAAISLLVHMRGSFIQVPVNGFVNIVKKLIVENYDGSTASIRNIARNYGVTEFFIRTVLSENKVQAPEAGQKQFDFMNQENVK